MKLLKKLLLFSLSLILLTSCSSNKDNKEDLKKDSTASEKIDFILDWVPNTNHTGLYVMKEKGYDKELGIDIDIKRPPEGSTSDLIALGKANFGIGFQDALAKKFEKGINLKAVATIIDDNTSGIISDKSKNIISPKDMSGHSYGTWNDPIEQAIIKNIVEKDGGNFKDIKLVPNDADNSVVGISNKMFDSAWVYYAWDGIMAKSEKVDTNFFYIKDYNKDLNYYSPIIIANSEYINSHKDITKKVMQAIKKGYMYAMEHPKESAEILIKYADELKDKKDFVISSQEYISKQYSKDPKKWGFIDKTRWNNFYKFLYENKILEKDLTNKELFTNEFLN